MDTSRQYLKRLDENRCVIVRHGAMNVDGLVFVDDDLWASSALMKA